MIWCIDFIRKFLSLLVYKNCISFPKFVSEDTIDRSSLPEVFCKKGVLKNCTKFTGKHLCQSLFLKQKDTGISFEFYKIFKNTFFHRAPPMVASEFSKELL